MFNGAQAHKLLFFVSEKFGVLVAIWHAEPQEKCDPDTKNALNDEKPPPVVV
jgi:hypothetical protein